MSGFRNIGNCEIPNEWSDVALGDEDKQPLLLMRNGLTKTQNEYEGTFKVSRIETISDGVIDESRIKYLSDVSSDEIEKYLIKVGDILFSHINSDVHLGKTAIAKKDYDDLLHGMNLLLFRVNKNVFDPSFLFFVMNYYRSIGVFIAICSRAVNQSSINQGKLKALKVPLPPLPEQTNIVHVLSKIQSAIETQDKIIKTTIELRKVLMQKLFTEGLKGEAQKDTEVGRAPKSWDVKRINEVYDFTNKPRGLDLTKIKQVPFIPMELIPDDNLFVRDFVLRKVEDLTSGTYIENGDLLIAKITPSFENGKQAMVDFKYKFGFATTEVIPIKEKEAISSKEYLFYYLLKDDVRSLLAGKMEGSTGRQRLSKTILGETLIPLPSYDEQVDIADSFIRLDNRIQFAKKKKGVLTTLFKSMLHHLMTGQIRVKDIRFS